MYGTSTTPVRLWRNACPPWVGCLPTSGGRRSLALGDRSSTSNGSSRHPPFGGQVVASMQWTYRVKKTWKLSGMSVMASQLQAETITCPRRSRGIFPNSILPSSICPFVSFYSFFIFLFNYSSFNSFFIVYFYFRFSIFIFSIVHFHFYMFHFHISFFSFTIFIFMF